MAIKTLLSYDLWAELARIAKKHQRLRAAISYVTASHIAFNRGDILICDASDKAIEGGLTSASTLRMFFSKGAEIYSFSGLHSKVAVIDKFAVIGSANLSENAGKNTCEASLLTDDPQITGLVLAFIEKLKNQSTPITEEFLKRIESLEVKRTPGIFRDKHKKIQIGQSRAWFISTRPLSSRILEAEDAFEQDGLIEAQKRITKKGYEVRSSRWVGKSRFRVEGKPGDLVLEAFTEEMGNPKSITIFHFCPIINRMDHEEGKWTRFYMEVPQGNPIYTWEKVKNIFALLGVSNISPNSTRELKGKYLGILQLLE